ncbi:MAG: glutathionylspermidine synthase family protein [Thermodesulfobacteriota bacterium]
MKRLAVPERPQWQERLDQCGFSFHSLDGLYWREGVGYAFTAREIDELESATATLQAMCLSVVAEVIEHDLFDRLHISRAAAQLVRRSWERGDPSLYGRFDLAYDGAGPPKLLEYNADTPTSLFESSIAQWIWLQDLFPEADQFNSIHEKLAAAFASLHAAMPAGAAMHFACVKDHEEDRVTTEYLRDVACQAGIDGRPLFMEDLGYSAETGRFCDLDQVVIERLFKLYPWEWLLADAFGRHLAAEPIPMILEPAWKMVLSNKGLLPLLWQMYPDHPLLLPAAFSPPTAGERYVAKPFFSREGANITVFHGRQAVLVTGGSYGAEGAIYQEYHELPAFDGHFVLVGSWVVDGQPAGIGLREDKTPITTNASTFVPHLFQP